MSKNLSNAKLRLHAQSMLAGLATLLLVTVTVQAEESGICVDCKKTGSASQAAALGGVSEVMALTMLKTGEVGPLRQLFRDLPESFNKQYSTGWFFVHHLIAAASSWKVPKIQAQFLSFLDEIVRRFPHFINEPTPTGKNTAVSIAALDDNEEALIVLAKAHPERFIKALTEKDSDGISPQTVFCEIPGKSKPENIAKAIGASTPAAKEITKILTCKK